ncbi:ATPase domain-containing protein [Myxococcus hansupus]|uniref:ATPase domain-containing protein n=1 Tax=Pseudomyxococcus hansupus TaxID=1297742 RepID=UPI0002F46884|nr:ATPase domain-containing protein [Myxococcus hansupus]
MTDSTPRVAERIPTGIPGLDTVLHGGFRKARTYMLLGLPGSGKTIFANQVCFHHARNQGGRVLYMTLLAESHTELVGNLSSLSFFDSNLLPNSITYLSAFTVLEQGGLDALADLIRKETKSHQATLLVLDGLVAAEEVASSQQAIKKFIHGLQVVTGLMGCTTLILTTGRGQGLRAEHTMVDGLLLLRQRMFGARAVRELFVRKFRGSPYLLGKHSFEITQDGIVIYPRLETLAQSGPPPSPPLSAKCEMGVPGLDAMLNGGVARGSTTILLGPSGSGKTLLGLNFLAEGARQGERVHYFAFYDSPERMVSQAAGIGLDLKPFIDRGDFEVSFRPPTENLLDKLGVQLLDIIRTHGVRRIFLDGYDALRRAAVRQSRVARFLAALVNECRMRGVTLLYSVESTSSFGPEVRFPMKGISMVAENVLYVRHAELDARLHRFIAVLKLRNSSHDQALRELNISAKGMEVTGTFAEVEMMMTGLPRKSAPRHPDSGHRGK